jgi:hypothetical protein
MTDKFERAAILGLLLRREKAVHREKAEIEIKEAAEAGLKEARQVVASCNEGLKAFDLDVNNAETFEMIKREYGPDITLHMRGDDDDELDFGSGIKADNEGPSAPSPGSPSRPTVAEIVLDRLKEAGDSGSKATPIRQYLRDRYQLEVHEKTVGMSLYRLLKKGLVRRDGRIWFFVPQTAETKNPGTPAPGSLNDLLT